MYMHMNVKRVGPINRWTNRQTVTHNIQAYIKIKLLLYAHVFARFSSFNVRLCDYYYRYVDYTHENNRKLYNTKHTAAGFIYRYFKNEKYRKTTNISSTLLQYTCSRNNWKHLLIYSTYTDIWILTNCLYLFVHYT